MTFDSRDPSKWKSKGDSKTRWHKKLTSKRCMQCHMGNEELRKRGCPSTVQQPPEKICEVSRYQEPTLEGLQDQKVLCTSLEHLVEEAHNLVISCYNPVPHRQPKN
jgi:hypothetical protein